MVRICLDWGWVIQCWSMKFCEMRDLMLIDEGLWDELVFFFVHRGLSSMHAQVTCAFEMEELAHDQHGTLGETSSFLKKMSDRCGDAWNNPSLLFCVHDFQFLLKIQGMWRCYRWRASPIAWSLWRIKLSLPNVVGRRHYLSSMPAAAMHIACCVNPNREVQISKDVRFLIWKN